MRVIAGRFRGIPLQAPPGMATRPITDRVKETIFSVLGSRLGTLGKLPQVHVLDLFSGSGSFGIEALSRGVSTCTFVDFGAPAIAAIRANLEKVKADESIARVRRCDAWKIIPAAPSAAGNDAGVPNPDSAEGAGVPNSGSAVEAGHNYGLIFVDPPYRDVRDDGRIAGLLDRLADFLTPGGIVIFRRATENAFDLGRVSQLMQVDHRIIGGMQVHLFLRSNEPPQADSHNHSF